MYKRYFSFSAFDGGLPLIQSPEILFDTFIVYSGERQWPFGPLVSIYMDMVGRDMFGFVRIRFSPFLFGRTFSEFARICSDVAEIG